MTPHDPKDICILPNLMSALIDLGFPDIDLYSIVSGDWLRIFRVVRGA